MTPEERTKHDEGQRKYKEYCDRVTSRRKSVLEMYRSAQCGELPKFVIDPTPHRFDLGLSDGAGGGLPHTSNQRHMQLAFAVATALYSPLKLTSGWIKTVEISYHSWDLSFYHISSERKEQDGINLNVTLEIRPYMQQGTVSERFEKRFGNKVVKVIARHAMEHSFLLGEDNPPDLQATAKNIAQEVVRTLEEWFEEYKKTLNQEMAYDLEAVQPFEEHFFGK